LIPAIDIQMKWLRIPRRTAILTTVLIGCVILALGALAVTYAANQILSGNSSNSQSKDDSDQSKADYAQYFRELLVKTRGILPPEWYTSNPKDPNALSVDPSEPLIRIPTNTIRKVLTEIASSIMGVISNGLLVLIFMIFMLAGKGTYKASPGSLWWEVESRIKRYVLTMILTSGITGVLVGFVLFVLKVNFYYMFGFLAFLLNFIPNITRYDLEDTGAGDSRNHSIYHWQYSPA